MAYGVMPSPLYRLIIWAGRPATMIKCMKSLRSCLWNIWWHSISLFRYYRTSTFILRDSYFMPKCLGEAITSEQANSASSAVEAILSALMPRAISGHTDFAPSKWYYWSGQLAVSARNWPLYIMSRCIADSCHLCLEMTLPFSGDYHCAINDWRSTMQNQQKAINYCCRASSSPLFSSASVNLGRPPCRWYHDIEDRRKYLSRCNGCKYTISLIIEKYDAEVMILR